MKRLTAVTLALMMVLSVAALAASPVDIQRQSINGSEYIVKT